MAYKGYIYDLLRAISPLRHWTEGSFRLGEDLSPIRGGATLQAARSPFGKELYGILQHVGTPELDVVRVAQQPEAITDIGHI